MCLWTGNSLLNFGSHPDPGSGIWLRAVETEISVTVWAHVALEKTVLRFFYYVCTTVHINRFVSRWSVCGSACSVT